MTLEQRSDGDDSSKCGRQTTEDFRDARIRELEARLAELEAASLAPGGREGLVAVEDLSKVQEVERALRDSDERLRRIAEIIDSIGDGFLAVDRNWRFTFINSRAASNGGKQPEELIGESLWAAFPSICGTELEKNYRKVMEERTPVFFEHESPAHRAWYATSIYPSRDGVTLFWRDISERKRAEEAFRQQSRQLLEAQEAAENEKLRLVALMEALPVGVALTDAHGGSVRSNKAYDQLWRGPRPEPRSVEDYAAYKAWWADTGKELAPEEWASAQAVKTGEPVLGQVLEIQRFDGTRATVINSGAPIRDAAGQVVGTAVAIQDITELREAEQTARKTHRAFVDAVESLQDGFMALDRECRFTYLNQAAARNVGYKPADLIGRVMWEAFPSLLGTPVEAAYRRVPDERVPVTLEVKGTLSERWYRLAIYPAAEGVTGIWTDITASKRTEDSLRESEARLRAAIKNAAFVAAQVDRELRYRWIFNPHPDFNASEVIGKRDDELENTEGVRRLMAGKRRVLESGVGLREEIAFERSDGAHVYDFSLEPLLDGAGAVIGVTSAAFDITGRKRDEEALRQANARLVDADNAKNAFLAVLSHELRNPLAPIKNSLYILDRAAPGGEQAKRAREVIDRQVAQLSRLVDDLLDVTRITRNRIDLQRKPLELNALVQRTVEDHRSVFDRNGIRLEVIPAPAALFVDADEARLAQVIGNLLQNAAKFTARSGLVRVLIATETSSRRAVLRVCDSGVGIEAEVLPKLFQPFMQADSSLDRSKGGLGLGLALVKGLVELHGGAVAAFSEGPGKGAEFTVRLPLSEPETDAHHPGTGEPRPRRRILIIEDNVDAAQSLRDVLELDGHEVALAHDGRDGIAKARDFKPEVVLCDIGLPGMNGYEVARAVRADEALKNTFLVALSGYALPEDLLRSQEAGFERHLAKPPNLEHLGEVLARLPAR